MRHLDTSSVGVDDPAAVIVLVATKLCDVIAASGSCSVWAELWLTESLLPAAIADPGSSQLAHIRSYKMESTNDLTDSVAEFFSYPFSTDVTYQQGLANIMNSLEGKSDDEKADILRRSKVYYFNHITGYSITVDDVSQKDRSMTDGNNVALQGGSESIRAPASNDIDMDNEPRILTFAELKALIEQGKTDQIPNNRIIPSELNERSSSSGFSAAVSPVVSVVDPWFTMPLLSRFEKEYGRPGATLVMRSLKTSPVRSVRSCDVSATSLARNGDVSTELLHRIFYLEGFSLFVFASFIFISLAGAVSAATLVVCFFGTAFVAILAVLLGLSIVLAVSGVGIYLAARLALLVREEGPRTGLADWAQESKNQLFRFKVEAEPNPKLEPEPEHEDELELESKSPSDHHDDDSRSAVSQETLTIERDPLTEFMEISKDRDQDASSPVIAVKYEEAY
ncbi:uncharacterized protein FIBRA_07634 [Fibroporia radiculosa]|uniref:Transmembrane protein n=1 Tax=Fibroporia radiculosa TaxID=599839 RepID=J4I115_9APHY|nr:uncharacterized protein FIBRA_07634 [Fibroporia radiculosa]CCM05417.1 predicted protein [Fibroporia radiculosa]